MMPFQTVTAPKLPSSWLKWEVNPDYTRKSVTLLAGDGAARAVTTGTLLRKIAALYEAASAAKAGGNTGAGTLTLDVTTPVLAGAKIGVYQVRCIATAGNGGTFRVTDPDGFVLGDVAVGATFANDIKFAIADGDPDFAVGDGFDITVEADTDSEDIGKYVAAATSETPDAIAIADAEAPDGEDAPVLVLDRGPAIVAAAEIAWPSGINAGQKAAMVAALALRDIDVR